MTTRPRPGRPTASSDHDAGRYIGGLVDIDVAPRPAGLLLDFYGTLVVDDDAAVASITATVSAATDGRVTAELVGGTWWSHFVAACSDAQGRRFRRQRDLAALSLQQTLTELEVDLDATGLTQLMLPAWREPPAYPDAHLFLEHCELPICVLSDIDRDELEAAIAHTQLPVQHVITSEDVRFYKPSPEGFRAAAAALDLPLTDLWHIGDALTSDVAGAAALGITTVWINRTAAAAASSAPSPDIEVERLTDLLATAPTAPATPTRR